MGDDIGRPTVVDAAILAEDEPVPGRKGSLERTVASLQLRFLKESSKPWNQFHSVSSIAA